PANSGTIRLCSPDGEPLEGEDLKTYLSAIPTDDNNPLSKIQKQSKMSALKLKAAAISVLALNGLGTAEDENSVSDAIEKLGASLKTAKDSLALETAAKEALQTKLDAQATATAT